MINARNGGGEQACEPIPVMRPQLPAADKLMPYLQRIDQARTYSNWGPLVTEFAERLGEAFGGGEASVICTNSGMSALIGGILATAGGATARRPLAIVPDFTFTATALAVQMCGYEPVLASCDADTWSFNPFDLLRAEAPLEQVGLVVPVAPFGRPVQQEPWTAFQRNTGIPVVIDGAACFEPLLGPPAQSGIGPLPVALSFHATKAFGTGEGGCVLTTDRDLSVRVLQALNFGFLERRNSAMAGFNGKMPEYAAAVGLAELDGWVGKARNWRSMAQTYRRAFAERRIPRRLWTAPDLASAYVLLQCATPAEAAAVSGALDLQGIDTRLWYGSGLHSHDIFRPCKAVDLHGQGKLEPRLLLGLPVAPDLPEQCIERVAEGVANALARNESCASAEESKERP